MIELSRRKRRVRAFGRESSSRHLKLGSLARPITSSPSFSGFKATQVTPESILQYTYTALQTPLPSRALTAAVVAKQCQLKSNRSALHRRQRSSSRKASSNSNRRCITLLYSTPTRRRTASRRRPARRRSSRCSTRLTRKRKAHTRPLQCTKHHRNLGPPRAPGSTRWSRNAVDEPRPSSSPFSRRRSSRIPCRRRRRGRSWRRA